MSESDGWGELLVEAPLVPDPDERRELYRGGGEHDDPETLSDADLQGSRLLLVRRAVEGIDLDGRPGGVVEIACVFQPAEGTRFSWARVVLRLTDPVGVRVLDLAPREVREGEPVKFTVDGKGKLGLKYQIAEAGAERSVRREFAVYHCAVQGSGEGTSLARWDFTENPHARDGIGREQVLALTLPVTGTVSGTLTANARLARAGLRGRIDRVRDLVLGGGVHERRYPVSFQLPQAPPPSGLARFLGLG
ncbi:MAG TPA: hypothetical protein VK358_09255 [Longimicrobium sp.]|nr:hypothetical protein [Longimicrobium sp.]